MPTQNKPTRRAITSFVNVSTSHRYEYGTTTIILWGNSLIRKKRRMIDTQTWEIHYFGSAAQLNPDPVLDIDGYNCEEAYEEQTLGQPLIVLHRETWTKRGKWEYYEEN